VIYKRVLVGMALVVALALSSDGTAQTGALSKDPTELLKKYVRLDYHGVRLEPVSQEAIRPYVTWQEEPAWGQVVVVSEYDIALDVKHWQVLGNLDVIIPVAFKVLGSVYLESATFLEERKTEEVRFHVKAVSGLWRIVGPMMPPHVSQRRMINYVREVALEERQPSRLEQLTFLKEALKNAR
jgi:hypothetical protein